MANFLSSKQTEEILEQLLEKMGLFGEKKDAVLTQLQALLTEKFNDNIPTDILSNPLARKELILLATTIQLEQHFTSNPAMKSEFNAKALIGKLFLDLEARKHYSSDEKHEQEKLEKKIDHYLLTATACLPSGPLMKLLLEGPKPQGKKTDTVTEQKTIALEDYEEKQRVIANLLLAELADWIHVNLYGITKDGRAIADPVLETDSRGIPEQPGARQSGLVAGIISLLDEMSDEKRTDLQKNLEIKEMTISDMVSEFADPANRLAKSLQSPQLKAY